MPVRLFDPICAQARARPNLFWWHGLVRLCIWIGTPIRRWAAKWAGRHARHTFASCSWPWPWLFCCLHQAPEWLSATLPACQRVWPRDCQLGWVDRPWRPHQKKKKDNNVSQQWLGHGEYSWCNLLCGHEGVCRCATAVRVQNYPLPEGN